MKATLKQEIAAAAHFSTQARNGGLPDEVVYDFGEDWTPLPFNNGIEGRLVTREWLIRTFPEHRKRIQMAFVAARKVGKIVASAAWRIEKPAKMFPHYHTAGEITVLLAGDHGEVTVAGQNVDSYRNMWYVPPFAIHKGTFGQGLWLTILVDE